MRECLLVSSNVLCFILDHLNESLLYFLVFVVRYVLAGYIAEKTMHAYMTGLAYVPHPITGLRLHFHAHRKAEIMG